MTTGVCAECGQEAALRLGNLPQCWYCGELLYLRSLRAGITPAEAAHQPDAGLTAQEARRSGDWPQRVVLPLRWWFLLAPITTAPAQILRLAADLVEDVGWAPVPAANISCGLVPHEGTLTSNAAISAWGAILTVALAHVEDGDVPDVYTPLADWLGLPYSRAWPPEDAFRRWEREPGRSQQEVVAALRAAADMTELTAAA